MSDQTTKAHADTGVRDPQVCKEFGITFMSLLRWDADPAMAELGWAPPMQIRKRKYRSRQMLDAFKAKALARAIKQRAQLLAKPKPKAKHRRAKAKEQTK